MKSSLIATLLLTSLCSLVLSKLDGVCRSKDGSGRCKRTSGSCNGFFVTGACPKDPPSIKCCVQKSCLNGGACLDKSRNSCNGGKFQRGFCPGNNDVQCCLKDLPPPVVFPPIKPCHPWTVVNDGIIDDLYFSRKATKQLPAILTGEAITLGACAAILGAFTGVGALPCGLVAAPVGWLAFKADECKDKNMCLKLNEGTIPECVGDRDPHCC